MDKRLAKRFFESSKEIISESDLGKLNTAKNVSVKVVVRETKGTAPDYVMLFQKFAYLAAQRLTASELRVFLFLLAISQYENFIEIDIRTISEEIKISERQIKKSLKELTSYNIIVINKNTFDRRRHVYFINPYASWRGNTNARTQTLKKLLETDMQLDLFSSTAIASLKNPEELEQRFLNNVNLNVNPNKNRTNESV